MERRYLRSRPGAGRSRDVSAIACSHDDFAAEPRTNHCVCAETAITDDPPRSPAARRLRGLYWLMQVLTQDDKRTGVDGHKERRRSFVTRRQGVRAGQRAGEAWSTRPARNRITWARACWRTSRALAAAARKRSSIGMPKDRAPWCPLAMRVPATGRGSGVAPPACRERLAHALGRPPPAWSPS
jgi:hypothetical protein